MYFICKLFRKERTISKKPKKCSDIGLALIKKWEGCKLESYQDGGGVWTIGYGHTGPVKGRRLGPEMRVSLEEAEELLRQDLETVEATIIDTVEVPLTQNQFDSLCCFIYNVGSGAFRKSTLLGRLNSGLYEEAADQLLRWDKDNGKVVKGLSNRRKAERELFLG